jgi:hypothetical protein
MRSVFFDSRPPQISSREVVQHLALAPLDFGRFSLGRCIRACSVIGSLAKLLSSDIRLVVSITEQNYLLLRIAAS